MKKKPDETPRCWFGQPSTATGKAPNYTGPHHCAECAAEVQRIAERA